MAVGQSPASQNCNTPKINYKKNKGYGKMSLPVLYDSVESYLVEISRFSTLSREEEHALSVDYSENKNMDSAHRLVTSNLRFVVKIAMEYRNYGVALKDLIQEGNVGLMTAVKKFNPYKGFRLITYAVWWIKACIQEFILKSKGAVKRSSKALKKKLFYRNMDMKALPSGEEVITTADVSLNTAISDGEEATHMDMLPDPLGDHSEIISRAEEQAVLKEKIGTALATLSDKERFVVEKRLMTDEPLSLQSIGDKLGLTRERVRQIEKATLGKLKKNFTTSPSSPELS